MFFNKFIHVNNEEVLQKIGTARKSIQTIQKTVEFSDINNKQRWPRYLTLTGNIIGSRSRGNRKELHHKFV